MNALRQEIEYLFDDFCDYMRRDTRGVEVRNQFSEIMISWTKNRNYIISSFQIAIYGTSSLLLAVAYHKIRPVKI